MQLTISLHPTESHQLLDLIENQASGWNAAEKVTFEAVYDKVADATHQARWLRDYVSLELEPSEAADLSVFLSGFHAELTNCLLHKLEENTTCCC